MSVGRAIVVQPGKAPEVVEFEEEKSYEFLKATIGDLFDVVSISEEIDCYVDDEGLIKRLEPTLPFGYQVLVGPLVFVGRRQTEEGVASVGLPVEKLEPLTRLIVETQKTLPAFLEVHGYTPPRFQILWDDPVADG